MRRFLVILPFAMLLSACADAPPPAQGPQLGITASFPRGGVADVIKVDALDSAPVRAVELVAPDGTTTTASSLDVTANPQTLIGQTAITDPWRSSGFGVNGSNPLPSGAPQATYRGQQQVLLTVSTADITLPDPVAYRRDWANYKIRLSFAAAGNQLDTREIPAPQPPPEPTSGG
jgi:hypothetical protein